MLASPEILKLQTHKQLLLAESSVNRHLLITQWDELRRHVTLGHRGPEVARTIRPGLILLAPLLGFFLVRRWRSAESLWHKALMLYRVAQKAWKVWDYLRS